MPHIDKAPVGKKESYVIFEILKTHQVNETETSFPRSTFFFFSSFRYAGYKQFTWWVHNHLGFGLRKVMPSCAVWAIRIEYPALDNKYIPFMEYKEEEKRLMRIEEETSEVEIEEDSTICKY